MKTLELVQADDTWEEMDTMAQHQVVSENIDLLMNKPGYERYKIRCAKVHTRQLDCAIKCRPFKKVAQASSYRIAASARL